MDETTLNALELPAVLAELATHAATSAGAAAARSLEPATDLGAIEDAFALLDEFGRVAARHGNLPLGGVVDIGPALGKAAPEGAALSVEELQPIASLIEASVAVTELLTREFREEFALLAREIERLSDQGELHAELARCIDENGRIADGASPELRAIRKELKNRRERARSMLDAMSRDDRYAPLLQEDIITIRDDRYVLCVRAESSSAIGGVVHGRSGSGASFFVEPFEVVEFNNRLAVLRKEERAEEARILRVLTRMVDDRSTELVSDYSVLGELDCLGARTRFAGRLGARIPSLAAAIDAEGGSGELKLLGARHPILAIRESGGGERAVPVDLIMDGGCRVLVISGANTGGKTVALKTLGLLTVMAASGIPIPVDEGSTALVFTDLFTDIGDSQDIASSLSTFSAHVKRLDGFLASAGPGSLVLVDEIGSGTNPSEGGALALAAIEALMEKGARVVVTTHMNLLKAHAEQNPACRNASVEFDEDSLQALYRLRYGVPGSSLGLSIAGTLGLPGPLIERARSYLDPAESAFVDSIASLAAEKAEYEERNRALARLEARRDEALRKLEEKRGEILERARAKVDAIITKARAEVAEAVREAREAAKAARRAAKGAPGAGGAAGAPKGVSGRVAKAGERAHAALGRRPREAFVPKVGDRARITGTGTKGVVATVDADGKRAELAVGAMKVWVAFAKLERVEGGPATPGAGRGGRTQMSARQRDMTPVARRGSGDAEGPEFLAEPSASINVIGMRAEEARVRVQRFLDEAHASGHAAVEVIHGVGTGVLKQVVAVLCGETPYVRGCRGGDPDHGGAGVTVVELS